MLNKSQVATIIIYRRRENFWYKYRKEMRFFGFITQKEGFYTSFSEDMLSEPPDNCYFEEKRVFYYPHIEFTMSDGKTYTKFFTNEKELDDYLETDEIKGITFITI